MISADVKANKNKKRSGGSITTCKCFLDECSKYHVKRAYIFHLILFGILSILILSVKNRGKGGTGQFI